VRAVAHLSNPQFRGGRADTMGEEAMYQRSDIREGMTVRSIDGEKLGRIFAIHDGEFLIEKGLFFPKDYVCSYSEISDLRDGEVILTHGKEGLHRFSFDAERGVLAGTGGGAGVGPGAVGMPAERRPDMTGLRASASSESIERPRVAQEEVPERGYRGDGDVEGSRKLDLTPEDPTQRRS
jgi:hypothetical protein